tara:strand:+ start:227 stop:409 length:183 start_codon:yes stop_codon:yes gene_type:complete
MREIKLTEEEILNVVLKWYLEDIPDIIQSENGRELDEMIETIIDFNKYKYIKVKEYERIK